MYEIDFLTCTMRDVIARSVACHPSLFAESLENTARIHHEFCVTTMDKTATRIALDMRAACLAAAVSARDDNVDAIISHGRTSMICAFTAAMKLQCLPRYIANEICDRDSEFVALTQ